MSAFIAQVVIAQHASGCVADVDAIPPWQWDIWFDDLAPICPSRVAVVPGRDFNRQRNALRMENTPSDEARCSQLSPDGRGLAWLMSGGSPFAYGKCLCRSCPRRAPLAVVVKVGGGR